MPTTDASADSTADLIGRGRIAVPVPCYNDEAAIGKIVAGRHAAPSAGAVHVHVYDSDFADVVKRRDTKIGREGPPPAAVEQPGRAETQGRS